MLKIKRKWLLEKETKTKNVYREKVLKTVEDENK